MTKLLRNFEALRLQHERQHNSVLKLVQKIPGLLQIYKHLCNGCVLVTSLWSVCVCQRSYRGKWNRLILLLKFQYRNLLFQCWREEVRHIVHGYLITSFGQRTLGVWRETGSVQVTPVIPSVDHLRVDLFSQQQSGFVFLDILVTFSKCANYFKTALS